MKNRWHSFSGGAAIPAVQKPELRRRDLRGRHAFGARTTDGKQVKNEKRCTAAAPLHERSKTKLMAGEVSRRSSRRKPRWQRRLDVTCRRAARDVDGRRRRDEPRASGADSGARPHFDFCGLGAAPRAKARRCEKETAQKPAQEGNEPSGATDGGGALRERESGPKN
jgi:hypothetical protein